MGASLCGRVALSPSPRCRTHRHARAAPSQMVQQARRPMRQLSDMFGDIRLPPYAFNQIVPTVAPKAPCHCTS